MRWITTFLLLFCLLYTQAQEKELTIEEQLLQLDLEMDSISLFGFLDSILALPMPSPKSEVSLRLGYASSRLTAGRDFNLSQKGITPGVAYYHKTGLYGDFSTFFDPQYSPAAYQSILHGGYMWLPSSKWVINPYVEHVFNYHAASSLHNSLGSSISYNFKIFEAGIDYAFLWGNDTGHRLIPSLSRRIRINNVPLVKSLSIYPSISLMSGTTTIFRYQYSSNQIDQYLIQIQQLTDDEIRLLVISGNLTTQQAIQLRATRRLLNEGTSADRAFLKEILNTLEEDAAFALLSYTFSIPISISIKNTNIMVSYSYSFPQRVPGEDLAIDPTGFFSFTISQRLSWK